ncbi:hypothetical protein [Mycolicibacterium goodii]|uniref:Intersectin-EH binding protein Ibp1 n=1 Tax=Mycolicibacterium goodii TaxID=134601 RepID=A0ABS6HNA6_MYCGD|nr:hypothetical protein [Mycolicibacterium goodii]OKH67542.1 hypothetical protein EB74_01370 [Mycobacterium sp. SWH-M5]MBU8810876.1 hypothetical protein [Mycolicibacterium goodii]MBU8820563.1 hypothetical protein [Mycolicibacterium goodii]MBU8823683.1 hypothetical protein [Mycolicibacterium goodii]MBU8833183.1 hypothetical protein [Mycolicibacterium goodii]
MIRTVFAAAAGALGVAALALSPAPTASAACHNGEEEDTYTMVCTPFLVPNSPFGGIPGNPDLPAVNLPGGGGAIPCTGHNAGECIGLAEEDAAEGPMAVPRSTISASP